MSRAVTGCNQAGLMHRGPNPPGGPRGHVASLELQGLIIEKIFEVNKEEVLFEIGNY